MTRRLFVKLIQAFSRFAVLAIACLAVTASAQSAYPQRPITLVVPFAPGSGADLTARSLSKDMTQALKQPVIVSNRPGANGAIGATSVATAAPDGYTLFMGSGTTNAANYAFRLGNLGYTPKSFDAVSGIGASAVMLYVAQSNPANDLKALVADAKKNVGKLSCSSGNAVTEVACAVFKKRAGLFAPTIPYRSNAQSLQDVAGGIVSFAFSDPSAAAALVDGKRIKPLAIAARQRSTAYPDVPTFAELGYADMEIIAWTGLFAPAGTPRDILQQLNAVVKAHVEADETVKLMRRIGSTVIWSNPADAQKFVDSEVSKWKRYVDSTGIKPFL
jgi:tripartite-type tricarboxylate transporter receptor subunit TctC